MTFVVLHTFVAHFRVAAHPYLAEKLPHHLDEVGMAKVHDVLCLHAVSSNHIRPEQVVASWEAGGETLLLIFLKDHCSSSSASSMSFDSDAYCMAILGRRTYMAVTNQINYILHISKTRQLPPSSTSPCRVVFLAQLHTLPSIGCCPWRGSSDSPELDQLRVSPDAWASEMFVKVIICIYRCPEGACGRDSPWTDDEVTDYCKKLHITCFSEKYFTLLFVPDMSSSRDEELLSASLTGLLLWFLYWPQIRLDERKRLTWKKPKCILADFKRAWSSKAHHNSKEALCLLSVPCWRSWRQREWFQSRGKKLWAGRSVNKGLNSR